VGCSGSSEESIKMGFKDTEILEIKRFTEESKAKNVILVIGDGTGINQITLSRMAIGGKDYRLAIDQMPIFGMSLTHSFNDIYTDSAAAATAWSAGQKTKNRYLSIDSEKNKLESIPEKFFKKGYLTGIVATSSITHATPAAFYAHIDSRYKEKEIANQLLLSKINIALGGGAKFFDLKNAAQTHVIIDQKELLEFDFKEDKKILGLFDEDGIIRSVDKPSQKDMTNFALKQLSMNESCNGFFLMSEASQIDWAAHDNDAKSMITEFKDFDNTIRELINFVTKDMNTLLLITADHETGGLQIMNEKDNNIIIQWGTGRHTGIPVGVYAYGPGAHLFSGLMDNTDIHNKILDAVDYANLENSECRAYQ
tara:strand:- start:25016 stop:26116 length:1101 start_codon:yes stop_codon:yes gene_type:complete